MQMLTPSAAISFCPGQYAPHTAMVVLCLPTSWPCVQQAETGPGRSFDDFRRKAMRLSVKLMPHCAAMSGQKLLRTSPVSQPSLHRQPAGTPNAPANAAPAAPAAQPSTNPPPNRNLMFERRTRFFDAAIDLTKCESSLTKKIRFEFLNDPPANTWEAGYGPWPEGKAEEWQTFHCRCHVALEW